MKDRLEREATEFHTRLLTLKRTRIKIETIRSAFAETFPDLNENPDRPRYIEVILKDLADQGLVEYPSRNNKRAWLRESNPVLPAWVNLRRNSPISAKIDPKEVPWLAELAFCSDLKHPANIEAAYAINNFLIHRRRDIIAVPLRERSLQIFGDEKRLDSLVENASLFNGQLPLSVLGAFEVEHPFAYSPCGLEGKPVLVVENHHTYWSFSRWNERVRSYSAIVFGSGNKFAKTGNAIDEVLFSCKSSEIEYFGDLDPEGLAIPIRFNRVQAERKSPCARPAVFFYKWLLENGVRRVLSTPVEQHFEQLNWLPEPIRPLAQHLFSAGFWIPQESLGTEELRRF